MYATGRGRARLRLASDAGWHGGIEHVYVWHIDETL